MFKWFPAKTSSNAFLFLLFMVSVFRCVTVSAVSGETTFVMVAVLGCLFTISVVAGNCSLFVYGVSLWLVNGFRVATAPPVSF